MQGNRTPLAPISGNRGITTPSVTGSFKVSDILDNDDYILPPATFAHQRCRILFASKGNAAAAKVVGRSQLSFAGRSASTTGYPWPESTDVSDSKVMSEVESLLFHPFNGLTEGQPSTIPEQTAIRDGECEVYEENDVVSEGAFVDENEQGVMADADDVSQNLGMLPATTYEGDSAWKGKMKASVPLDLEPLNRSKSAEELSQTNDGRPHARLRRQSQEPTEVQRAKNREARLIDGNIVLPPDANEDSPQPLSPNEIRVKVEFKVEEEEGAQTTSRGWSTSQQDQDSPRYSWLDSIRTTLRPGSQGRGAKSSSDDTSPPQSSKGTSKSFIWSDNGESHHSHSNGTPSPLFPGPDATMDSHKPH